MPAVAIYDRVTHTRRVAMSVIDAFARELGVRGAFAPPQGEIALEITAQSEPDIQTFVPPLKLWSIQNTSGFVIIDGTYTQVSRGTSRLPLPDGRYQLRIRGEFYQDLVDVQFDWRSEGPTRVPVDSDGNPVDLTLFPGPRYPLPEVYADRSQLGPTILRGSLFTSSGEPIAGARVEVRDFALNPPWPFLSCVTGASGDWAIWLPDRSRFEAAPLRIPGPRDDPIKKLITVRIQYPDQNGFSVDVTDDVLLGTEHAIRNTALRGQVRGPGGRPIIGARIETSVGPEASFSRSDGQWFLYFGLNQPDVTNVIVTVTTPDGGSASDSSVSVVHGATVVVPAFNVS